MDEPPSKRPRRTEGSSRRDDYTPSPRSPRPHDSRREEKGRSRHEEDRGSTRKEDSRRLSRSPHELQRERSRSRDRRHRELARRDVNGHRRRSRSGETQHGSRDYRSSRHERRRSRSASPPRNGDERSFRHRSPIKQSRPDERPRERDKKHPPGEEKPQVKLEVEEKKPKVNGTAMELDEDEEDALLRRMMGFTKFNTTQNKKVPGNQIYGVRKEKKTEYRQYMNRVGGFNRPLSPSR